MFPQFSVLQKRAIYLLLFTSIGVGAIFFSLAQSNSSAQIIASQPSPPLVSPSISPLFTPLPTPVRTIVVDVAGKVAHPGVYKLPQGSRAVDAIKAAGRALRGVLLTDINLAEVLSDGQQIIVGAPAVTLSSRASSSKLKGATNGKSKITSGTININLASVLQFEQLPGVGAVMAARIFAYRKIHGAFATIDEITKVTGMGKSKFANLKSFIRV